MSIYTESFPQDPAHHERAGRFEHPDDQQSMIKLFFDNSPLLLGVAELDGDTVIAVNGNAAVASMLGLKPEEIPDRTGVDLGDPPEESRLWLEHYRQSQREGRPVQFEFFHQGRGGPRWVHATVNYLGTGRYNRPRFSFIAEDITQRKQLDEALQASERRYRELIQYAPVGIYEIDFRTGRFTSVNDSMVDLTGYSREELLNMSAFDLLDADSQVLFRERIRQWLSGEAPLESVEYRVIAKDGHTIYAVLNVAFTRDERGRPLGATVVGYDITTRKLAELALRESEERFRASIETTNENFTVFSAVRQDGKIIDFRYEYANRNTCESLGRTLDQLTGRTIGEILPEWVRNNHDLTMKYIEVVETGTPMHERVMFTGDGAFGQPDSRRVLDIRASKLGDGMIVTSNDVTEQARLEAEHIKATQEREIHHRLTEQREKERQSIARDLHDGPIQSLSSLAFSLQFLKETYTDASLQLEIAQIAASVKDVVQELRQVMNELRPPSVIRFGLSAAIQWHVEHLRERYPRTAWNLKLDRDVQLLPEQTCLALFRVYQEAVNNIIRHSEASEAWILYRIGSSEVLLEIADNGRGFENCGDIVSLTSSQHFGLAGITERLHAIEGSCEIHSVPGEGTTLRVRVPVRKAAE